MAVNVMRGHVRMTATGDEWAPPNGTVRLIGINVQGGATGDGALTARFSGSTNSITLRNAWHSFPKPFVVDHVRLHTRDAGGVMTLFFES